MRIPLHQFKFTEEEFVGLVIRLEYPDLTHFDFQSMNLKKLTQLVLTPDLKFKTTDTIFLSTLAKVCAQHDEELTAKYIQNFVVADEAERIGIAMLCAQQDSLATAKYIQNFAIADEAARIAIARLCAKQEGEDTAEYIQNFAIADEAARIEIAELCAKSDGITALYIEKFSIRNEAARIEIAKFCAQQDSRSTAEYIQNFAIADVAARIDIARLCAKQDGESTAEYIRNFAIADEAARIEIAELCVQQDGPWTAHHIRNFAIQDETARVEIAKICAKSYGGVTAYRIQNFAIEDEEALLEIARLCAKQEGESTAEYIQNFAIANERARIEIAKLCAQQNGRSTAEHIQNFAITDEAARIEIAKVCAQQNGQATAENINNFQIGNPHFLYQLFLQCLQADPKSLFQMNKISSLPKEFIKISPLIQILKSEAFDEPQRKKIFEEIRGIIGKISISNENRKTILEMSDRIEALPPHVQIAAALWLISSLLLMREMKAEEIEWLLVSGIWSELGLLKEPDLRISLLSGLHTLSIDAEKRKLWESFLCGIRGTEGQRGLMLLAIPFSNFQLLGIREGNLLAVANHLSALQRKNESTFRNVYQVKTLLHTMHSLNSINELTREQKQRGFDKIFCEQSGAPNAHINDERLILKNIIAAKGLLQLKDTQWPNATENLSVLFLSSLEKLIPLERFKGEVSAKYEEIFGASRNPGGLLIYAAGLKTLRDSTLLSCLGQYVVSVMEGAFKNTRYQTTQNPHLAKVLEGHPGLLSLWTEEIKLDLHTMIFEDKKEDSFDSEQWLHTKLLVDKHLGSEELSYLTEYIKTPSAEARKEIFSVLIKKIKEFVKEEENKKLRDELKKAKNKVKEIETNLKKCSGNEEVALQLGQEKRKIVESLSSLKAKLNTFSSSRANDPVLINLNFQKACLRLAQEGKISDKKSLFTHLENINQSLTLCKTSEFATDVKGLLATLKNETDTHRSLQVIFTDDPIDLLLCGTDVSGSCQRLNGNPNFNKGLLGYLMDGKNRLLAIKEGDKIVARCILRLLWDGNQPVVYRDRFYPDQIPISHKHALNTLAKQVSQKLCVPITCGEGSVPYNNSLQALGGPAPYEYCDGAGGVQKNGRYTIQAKLLE